ETAVASLARDFLQDTVLLEAGHQVIGGGVGDAEKFAHLSDGNDGRAVKVFQDAVAVGGAAAKLGGDQIAVLFSQEQDAAGGFGGLLADLVSALQEKVKPAFPVALVADGLEMVVVILAVTFEEVRQVQHG